MKFRKLNMRTIFGVFFLLLGISMLFKVFFHLDLPVFRLCFAVFLLYLGVHVLMGSFGKGKFGKGFTSDDGHSAMFSDTRFEFDQKEDENSAYNIAFGRGRLDLTKVAEDALKERNLYVQINTIFGETEVRINPKLPLVIRSNAAFGEARMPDDNMIAFGKLNYRSPGAKTAKYTVVIESNVVFGAIRFVEGS